MKQRSSTPLPLPAKRALKKLGGDIRTARLRRRIQTQLMADRALISRTTLKKIEDGDPSVSMGNYATVLFILGFAEPLGQLIDPSADVVASALDEERLPKRIRNR